MTYYMGSTTCSGSPIAMTYTPNQCLHDSIIECGSGCPAFTGTPSPTPPPATPIQPPPTCQATHTTYTDQASCSGSPTSTSTHQVWTSAGSPCFAMDTYSLKGMYCDAAGYHHTIFMGTRDCSGTPIAQTFSSPAACSYGSKFACGSGCPTLGPTPAPTPAPPTPAPPTPAAPTPAAPTPAPAATCTATWRQHTDTTNCTDGGATTSFAVRLAPGSPCEPVTGTLDSVKDQYCDSQGFHQTYYLGNSSCGGSAMVTTFLPGTCLQGHAFVCGSGCPALSVSGAPKQNLARTILPLVAAGVWGRAALVSA